MKRRTTSELKALQALRIVRDTVCGLQDGDETIPTPPITANFTFCLACNAKAA